MTERPPFGILARNVLAVIAATIVSNTLLLLVFGAPESETGFVLEVGVLGMATFCVFFWVEGKLARGESGLGFALMVLGIPLLNVVGMVVATRLGTTMGHLLLVLMLMLGLSSVAMILRTFK